MTNNWGRKLSWLAILWVFSAGTLVMGQGSQFRPIYLPGTWYVTVPDADGVPGFHAYQTFNADGTMTETSDLLSTLTEGPAHGAWKRIRDTFYVTFELFAFEEDGTPSGRIRVRVELQLTTWDHFEAMATVDVILPDGTEINDVGQTPFSADRVRVRDLAGNIVAGVDGVTQGWGDSIQ